MAGTDRYFRSTSHQDSAMDELTTAINTIVDEIDAFVTQWNLKQGGASVVIATIGAYKVLGVAIPASAASTAPATVDVHDGDSQSTTPATALSTDLAVIVKDGTGTVVNGATVTWASTDADAVFSTQSITDATGITSIPYTTGFFVGDYTVTASVDGATSATFTVSTTAGTAALLLSNSSQDQSGTTSTAVADPPSVVVTDVYGNPVAGETVTFAVTAGGGSRSPATVDTGADGIATLTSWTLGAAAGANTLTATVTGLTGSPVTFSANAVASTPTQIAVTAGGAQTGVVAGQAASATTWTVKDAGNNAVQGVTVAFTVTSGNGSLSAASAVTNASGQVSVTYTTHTTVETATITASFNAGAVSAGTTIASTFGSASKLALQTQPSSSGDSGTALSQQPIVLVQDANGNTVTSSTATITASVQSGNATISAGSTAVASAGVATFSGLTLVDTDSGTNILRFSSGALTVVDSTGTVLAPPIPVAVQFQVQPGNATTGASTISCAAWVVDDSNVLVTSATNAITVALTTPGGATLSGTLTVNASGGIASFSGLAVDTAGTYTLTATATGLTSATSTSFSVTDAGGSYPNEPAGFTDVHTTDFVGFTTTNPAVNSGSVSGLVRYQSGNQGREFTDTIAPFNGTSVFRVTFPNGSTQGTGPEHLWPGSGTQTIFTPYNFTQLYTAAYIRVDSDWRTPTGSGVQKLFHIWGLCDAAGSGQGGSLVVPSIVGAVDSTTAPIRFQIRYQNCSTVNGAPTSFNGTQVAINRGQWYLLEVYVKMNSGSAADGVCSMYVDGVERVTLSNITFRNGGSKEWTTVQLNPTYGGSGTVTGPQYLYYANWRTAGA